MQKAKLVRASRVFAVEKRWLSWLHLWTAIVLLTALLAICASDLPWFTRLPASFLAGLTLVRLFIIYHDFQHGTILRGSRLARVLMSIHGILTLNPPSIWNRSHNHHHKNTAKIFGAAIGSYPVMTVTSYQRATPGQRLGYAISRHPLTIMLGYLTIFLYGMCFRSFVASPRAHLDSALSLLVHAGVLTLAIIMGFDVLILAVWLPMGIGAVMGAYLFYAQHNYPGVRLHDRAEWCYVSAALESSSFIPMGRLMSWFTGNIGYHHVHHLNSRIPFYRLPEAMAHLKEMQLPAATSLTIRGIADCFRLKLWDAAQGRFVGFPHGSTAAMA